MKKIFPLLAILLLGTKDINAQIRFGGEKGISLNNLSSNNFPGDYRAKVGFRSGFVAEIPIAGGLVLQPGIGYSMKGADLVTNSDANDVIVHNKTKLVLNYVELPVNLVYNFGEPLESHFFIGAGPYAARLVGASLRQRTSTDGPTTGTTITKEVHGIILDNADNATSVTRTDFGVTALAGYQFGNRTYVKASGTIGFRNLDTGGEIPFDGRNIGVALSIGRYVGHGCH